MNTAHYLERIGYTHSLEPDLETLRRLHRQHLLQVPFENLDIHRGRPIALDPSALFDKIVRRHRGGFCYELNGLFAWLLRELGFEVRMMAARFLVGGDQPGPEFDHMALLVELDHRWLADVGYGDNFLEPVRLDSEQPHFEGDTEYRVVHWDHSHRTLERREPGEKWRLQYLFDTVPREIEEFEERCTFHQTSSESHFTQKRLCTKATPEGRITLSDLRLIESAPGFRRETDLTNEAHWHTTLKERFNVRFGPRTSSISS